MFCLVVTFHCTKHGAPASLVHSGLAQLSNPIFAQLIALLAEVTQLFLNGKLSLLGLLQGDLKSIRGSLFSINLRICLEPMDLLVLQQTTLDQSMARVINL